MRLHDMLRSAWVIPAFLLAAASLTAQERRLPPFVLGLGAGYDIGDGARINNGSNDRSYDQTSEIRTASVSFIFPKLFMNGWGLTTAISYGDYALSANGTGERTVYVGGAPTTGTTEHSYDLLMRIALMELVTHIHIGGNARLEVGPLGGIGFFPEYIESERIVGPSGATFSNGGTTWSDSVEAVDEGLFITGALLRVGYEVPFVGGLALMPSVTLRGIVGFDGDGDGIVVGGTAGLGLSLLTGRTGGEEAPILPVGMVDTVTVIDTVARASALRAEVDLYSIDSMGRRVDTLVIAMRRTLRRLEVPLATAVHFEPQSAALPGRFVRTASEAAVFNEEDLVAMSPGEIRQRSLEVLASRMRSDRTLRVSVAGTRMESEPAWFADARSRSARAYLQSVWGIDSSRVALSPAKGKTAIGAPAIRFTTRSTTALSPVISEWVEQQVDAAPVGVRPTIVSPDGVDRWRVAVMQGDREIGVVRSTDSESARHLDIGTALRRLPRDEAQRALVAELVVEDSVGGVAVARDRMDVVVDTVRGSARAAEELLEEYLIPVGDEATTRTMLERVVQNLPANARVTIVAPTGLDGASTSIADALRTSVRTRRDVGITIDHEDAGSGADRSLVVVRVEGDLGR